MKLQRDKILEQITTFMPHDLVRPEEKTFRELIQDPGRLKVPFLQRNYVWQEIHFSKVLEDIKANFDTQRLHFTGSIITAPIDNERHVQLIDGQQRLTTLVIICKAVKDCLNLWELAAVQDNIAADEITNIKQSIHMFNGQEQQLQDIVSGVYNNINELRYHAKFLSLKANDGDRLNHILGNRTLAEISVPETPLLFRPVGIHGQGYPKIYRAYDAIFKSLLRGLESGANAESLLWFGKQNQNDGDEDPATHISALETCQAIFEKLVEVLEVVNNRLLFLRMHILDDSYIYDIFNTVNSLGHKLSRFDLLRNKVVQKIDQFNMTIPEKDAIMSLVMSFSDDEVVKDNEVSKFMEIFAQVKLGAFNRTSVDSYWDDWVENSFENYQNGLTALQIAYKDLKFYLNLTKATFPLQANEEMPNYSILNNKLKWINFAKVKLHLPLMVNAYLSNKTPEQFLKLLEFVEKLYLYWRVYKKELPQYTKNLVNSSMNGVMHKLDCECSMCTNQNVEIPPSTIDWDADEFEGILDLMEQKIFNEIDLDDFRNTMVTKNDYSSGLSKFLLWNIENKLSYLRDEEMEFENHDLIEEELEQEHIMPKRGTPALWEGYAENTDLNKNNIEKLGNHTLYRKIPNIKLGRREWAFKRQFLPAENLEILLNHDNEFCEQENWGEEEIDSRSSDLIGHVISLWFE